MLYRRILNDFNAFESIGTPNPRTLESGKVYTWPHYYVTTTRLLSMTEALRGTRDEQFELSYININLPHDCMFLSVKNDQKKDNTIDEMLLLLSEGRDSINVTAFITFRNDPRILVHITSRLSKPKSSETGCDFTFISDNIKKFFPDPSMVDRAEKQLSQFIYNAIANFNFVLNNSKDLREGIEVRSIKLNKGAKGKKAYQDVTIIHLNSHKYLNSVNYNTSKTIEWNHSWVVRGHWRYFNEKTKLGKDRAGDRGEFGRTWIMPYQKQKDLEFKNKIREIRI